MRNKLNEMLKTALVLVVFGIFILPVYALTGDNTDLSLAWHEASYDVFVRGHVFSAGLDIDQDGVYESFT